MNALTTPPKEPFLKATFLKQENHETPSSLPFPHLLPDRQRPLRHVVCRAEVTIQPANSDEMNMTDEEMRIKIAKACGWRRSNFHNQWLVPREPKESSIFVGDPLQDLNAMHEAEQILDENQYNDFVCFLCPDEEQRHYRSWGLEGVAGIDPRLLVSPTARQRAIAFIKTLNLEPK